MAEADTAPAHWQGRTLWARDRSAPLREFLRTESGSAMVLVAGIAAAMIWANTSDASYESFWHARVSIGAGPFGISQDLRTWLAIRFRLQPRSVVAVLGIVIWGALRTSGIDPVAAGLAIGLAAPACTPAPRRTGGRDGAGPPLPGAADVRVCAGGPGRPGVRTVAERTLAGVLPSVDQLRDRAAVRLGQRRNRGERSHAHATRIAQDLKSADLSGVSGTPTFFINGQRHYGAFDLPTLTAAIRTERDQLATARSRRSLTAQVDEPGG